MDIYVTMQPSPACQEAEKMAARMMRLSRGLFTNTVWNINRSGLQTFLPFFRESGCRPVIYSDSQPVVKAYAKMQNGEFSASPRVSTFLHQVLGQNAVVKYLAGSSNQPADQASRNAAKCDTPHCQVCSWVRDKESQVVTAIDAAQLDTLLAGNAPMPLTDHT